MTTTATKIAGEAMTDEQIIEMASRFAHSDGWLNGDGAIAFARALLASKPAVPWIAHWAGSNPYKGWSIRCGRDEIVWFGVTVSSETVEAIVLAHNKCFDCDGTGCVMNCSGLRSPAPASPSGEDAAEQADEAVTDEFRSIEDWQKHCMPNGLPEQPEFPQLDDARAKEPK